MEACIVHSLPQLALLKTAHDAKIDAVATYLVSRMARQNVLRRLLELTVNVPDPKNKRIGGERRVHRLTRSIYNKENEIRNLLGKWDACLCYSQSRAGDNDDLYDELQLEIMRTRDLMMMGPYELLMACNAVPAAQDGSGYINAFVEREVAEGEIEEEQEDNEANYGYLTRAICALIAGFFLLVTILSTLAGGIYSLIKFLLPTRRAFAFFIIGFFACNILYQRNASPSSRTQQTPLPKSPPATARGPPPMRSIIKTCASANGTAMVQDGKLRSSGANGTLIFDFGTVPGWMLEAVYACDQYHSVLQLQNQRVFCIPNGRSTEYVVWVAQEYK